MTNKLITPRFLFITAIILVASITRVFPHIPNFTPIAAMALFGGVYYSNKTMAFIMPLLAMAVSDILLEITTGWGFHNTMVYVYVSFILTTIIGLIIREKVGIKSVALGSIASSVLFFIITNFGVWAAGNFAGGLSGLNTTYMLGIPFFGPTLAGDLFFNSILFGLFYLAQQKAPSLVKVK
ncbi:MAG: hypothetical protein JNL69_12190 [Bacteroidia bacterium]|nr:hypothetical protein [Bacteroidia bacterium]